MAFQQEKMTQTLTWDMRACHFFPLPLPSLGLSLRRYYAEKSHLHLVSILLKPPAKPSSPVNTSPTGRALKMQKRPNFPVLCHSRDSETWVLTWRLPCEFLLPCLQGSSPHTDARRFWCSNEKYGCPDLPLPASCRADPVTSPWTNACKQISCYLGTRVLNLTST